MASYRDTTIIGSGGFGEVWNCERDTDGSEFAKKKLTDNTLEAIARFKKEARLLSSLDHPNIVKIVGRRLTNEPYYYVMPLYDHSLDTIIHDLAEDPSRIEAIFGRILDGVAYAHEQGVIHRDLKPQNVLLNDDVDLVVSDFGLGRQLTSESTRLTLTGIQMGTILYMAPEQFDDSKSVDERCDVYALGRILIHLYTGTLSPAQQDLSAIPPRFLPIVRRATHHDEDHRFPTAMEMRTAWQQTVTAGQNASESHSLQSLITQLAAEPSDDNDTIEHLINLLLSRTDDPDEIHNALMTIPTEVVGAACNLRPDDMFSVIEVFAMYIETQSFSFDYTDTLANQCARIIRNTEEPEIDARLATAVAVLGVDHNRWHVMEVAAGLVENVSSDSEASYIAQFADISEHIRQRIVGYLDLSKVPEGLRQLFEFNEE